MNSDAGGNAGICYNSRNKNAMVRFQRAMAPFPASAIVRQHYPYSH